MISESWFAIDLDDSPLRNREITTVMLASKPIRDPCPTTVVATGCERPSPRGWEWIGVSPSGAPDTAAARERATEPTSFQAGCHGREIPGPLSPHEQVVRRRNAMLNGRQPKQKGEPPEYE